MTRSRNPPPSARPLRAFDPTRRRRAFRNAEELRRNAPLIAGIAGIGLYAALSSDTFLTLNNFQNIFQQVAVLGILCVGSTLLFVAGKIDLSIGSAVSLVSVLGAKLLVESGASELTVAILMIAIGVLIGLLFGALIVTTSVSPFMLTLGGLSVLAAVALIVTQSRPVATGLAFSTLSIQEIGPMPVPAVIYLALALAGAVVLRFTSLGRYAYAIGSNEEAAFLAGVPLRLTTLLLYGINGLLVGVAAIMSVARVGSGDPTSGVGLELQAITAVLLGGATLTGGRGTMLGTFLGVLLLGVISNALQIAGVPSAWAQLVFGGVLVVAVTWSALRERVASRRSRRQAALGEG